MRMPLQLGLSSASYGLFSSTLRLVVVSLIRNGNGLELCDPSLVPTLESPVRLRDGSLIPSPSLLVPARLQLSLTHHYHHHHHSLDACNDRFHHSRTRPSPWSATAISRDTREHCNVAGRSLKGFSGPPGPPRNRQTRWTDATARATATKRPSSLPIPMSSTMNMRWVRTRTTSCLPCRTASARLA